MLVFGESSSTGLSDSRQCSWFNPSILILERPNQQTNVKIPVNENGTISQGHFGQPDLDFAMTKNDKLHECKIGKFVLITVTG